MNSRVCVDASIVLRWLLPGQQDLQVGSLLEKWDRAGIELIGPPLFSIEVTSFIRLNVFRKILLPKQGEMAYGLFRELNVTIVAPPDLCHVAWGLAGKYDRSRTYDMQYLAIAELENCEFRTADKRLINALKERNKRIRWIDEAIT
ncbi:MAG: type II toxin-antitoxin system VapC family toxin [Dehalococcoidales bacterium]|nr:type II toxin-antitoxin system VapC family toxin [Dehalococcoidales bacterium]